MDGPLLCNLEVNIIAKLVVNLAALRGSVRWEGKKKIEISVVWAS